MRIAIPIWEDWVSPVLDTASRLLIVEVEAQREASRFETYLDELNLSRRCSRIQGLGIDVMICGAISRPFSARLAATGIHIIPGISGHPEHVLKAYLQGNLYHSKFLMPGIKTNSFAERSKTLPGKKPHRQRKRRRWAGEKNLRTKM